MVNIDHPEVECDRRPNQTVSVAVMLAKSCIDNPRVKDNITSSGGSIKSDFQLVKGFTAEVPDGMVGVLSNDDLIENVEEDANVSIQQ
ncbi:protease B inhibitors 2 and 1 [Aspergillus udagawae]|uniref:Protease B inhibitors 2 and 1 n=1 Tax=Aspergillus udagawae TaxID=91492 RepID=A0A8H3N6P9_9EURO|nr:protease B inhibitors 2 and 1 [Aspergillus udagawae]